MDVDVDHPSDFDHVPFFLGPVLVWVAPSTWMIELGVSQLELSRKMLGSVFDWLLVDLSDTLVGRVSSLAFSACPPHPMVYHFYSGALEVEVPHLSGEYNCPALGVLLSSRRSTQSLARPGDGRPDTRSAVPLMHRGAWDPAVRTTEERRAPSGTSSKHRRTV